MGPNPADVTSTLREWEVETEDGNGPRGRDRIMAMAVHEDGSILTISCMSFPEKYCAPDAYRLEKFSPHGLLLAYTDHTSRKEQHVGPGGFFGFPGRSMRGQNVVASRDAVFVADTRNGRVAAFDVRTLQPEYTFGYLGRATGVTESPHGDVFEEAEPGALWAPRAMALLDNEIAVVDERNERVQVFDTGGYFARSILCKNIKSIASSRNHLYIAEVAMPGGRHPLDPSEGEKNYTREERDSLLKQIKFRVRVMTPSGHTLQLITLPGPAAMYPVMCASSQHVWVAQQAFGTHDAPGRITMLDVRDAELSPLAAAAAAAAAARSAATFEAADEDNLKQAASGVRPDATQQAKYLQAYTDKMAGERAAVASAQKKVAELTL